jgi:hypothetical protein
MNATYIWILLQEAFASQLFGLRPDDAYDGFVLVEQFLAHLEAQVLLLGVDFVTRRACTHGEHCNETQSTSKLV